jgi:hypothetical protein
MTAKLCSNQSKKCAPRIKEIGLVWIGLIWLRIWPVAGSYDHCNKTSGSIKCKKMYALVEWLWLLTHSVPWRTFNKQISTTKVLSLQSLPWWWCESNPWRTDHRRKQTLCRGCDVGVWWMCVSYWVHIHKVGPVVTWNTHQLFNHLQNHHYLCLICLIRPQCWETALPVTSTLN